MAIATLPPGGASGGTMDGHAALGEEGDEQEAAQMQGEYVALAKEDVKEVPETWVRPINRQNPKVHPPATRSRLSRGFLLQ